MDHHTETEQLVLHALRLRGLANEEAIASATGLAADELPGVLAGLAERGLVKQRSGRMAGWTLTPDGKAAHAEKVVDAKPEVAEGYQAFLPRNEVFKQLCTDWQLRDGNPNDHSDAAYDGAIVVRLGALNEEICPVTEAVAVGLPRFGRYAPRFSSALDRVRAGETAAFARPMAESYHDVWMELHQDLLLTLGRERDASDGH